MNKPRIIAAYGVRWEPQFLVDDLRENLSWVDGFAEIDNRDMPPDAPWGDENELYRLQRESALEQGADWILVTAPDERWDNCAEEVIRHRTSYLKRTILRCPIRAMYEPLKYRSDKGFWRHEESRIYKFWEDQEFDTKPFHNNIAPKRDRFTNLETIPVPIYDLKPIEPENRQRRVDAYKVSDPKTEHTVLQDYDLLNDEKDMELTEVIEPWGYKPAYTQPYYFLPTVVK